MIPKDLEPVYSRILQDATKIANRDIRTAYGKRHFLGLGWSPFRPNRMGPTGLGFTMSQVDAYRLKDDADLVNQITTNAIQTAIMKHKEKFFTFYLQDVLVTDEAESFFAPPKYDPRGRGSKYRNIFGRFTKAKYGNESSN